MKNPIKILILLAFVSLLSFPKESKAEVSISLQVFYDTLAPHGQWVESSAYGYAWIPNVDAGFTPYATRGHWVFTSYGWTWVSDYKWGWAPFHYGRWAYDEMYGWLWVPGTEWGPAWVMWRRAPGYYGWAPLGPGVSIQISFGNNYYGRVNNWVFVRERYVSSPVVYRYYAPVTHNQTIIYNTTVINNTYVDNSTHNTYISGPGQNDVEKTTGNKVKKFSINSKPKPGQSIQKGQLHIYRPGVVKNPNQKPAPTHVVPISKVKPSKQTQSKPGSIDQPPTKTTKPGPVKPAQKKPESNTEPSQTSPSPSPQKNNPKPAPKTYPQNKPQTDGNVNEGNESKKPKTSEQPNKKTTPTNENKTEPAPKTKNTSPQQKTPQNKPAEKPSPQNQKVNPQQQGPHSNTQHK